MWGAAIAAASAKATKGLKVLSDSDELVQGWIKSRGGELITMLSEESRKAVMNIILRGQGLGLSPKQTAKELRPLIGLTAQQAEANVNYRQKVYQRYIDGGASHTVAAARADKAALKYAGKQHRYRADTIVLTENSFAYNRGAHMGVGQAIADGLMGRCEMVWTTAGTNRVCSRCMALKDTVVGHTDESGVTIPPLHPRCRCTIMYQEVGAARALKPKPKPASAETAQEQSNFFIPNPNPLPLKSIGARHYATIQVILANAPNKLAMRVWDKFEDKIKIGAIDRLGTSCHFNGAIYFNLNEVAQGDIINKPYQLLFHEGAHNIDYELAIGNRNFSEYYNEEAFLTALEKDFAKLKTSIVEWKKKCRQDYALNERAILSDLLGLYSDGEHHLGTGHSQEYWLKGGRALKSREAFAEFMEAGLVNAPAYKILCRHLPTAAKTFDAMLEELLK